MNAAALLLPFVVALPPGATAPPPGALPPTARISMLDRDLGLALVRLPKRGLGPALRRLRAAPGVRYVERDAPIHLSGEGCGAVSSEDAKADPAWRSAIHLSTRSAAGIVIGMADSGVDDDRLAPRQPPLLHLSSGGQACAARPDRARHRRRQHPDREPARRARRGPRAGRDTAVGAHRQIGRLQPDSARAWPPGGIRLAAAAWRAGRERLGDGQVRRARSSNPCAHCSSRVRWSWPQSATRVREPKPQVPGLATGSARRRRACRRAPPPRSAKGSTRGTVSRSRRADARDQGDRLERRGHLADLRDGQSPPTARRSRRRS